MDLVTCKGLRKEVGHDMEFLERCIEGAEHMRDVLREAVQIYADMGETMRRQINNRVQAIKILEEYAATLEPAHCQIVHLRLLEGLAWADVSEATGYNASYAQEVYRNEVQRIPSDVLQRFCDLWPERIEDT